MKCLIDNNLPPALARALAVLSKPNLSVVEQVIPLRDRFEPATPDIEWIAALSKEGGWFVVSSDGFNKRGDLEREALRRSGLIVFCLSRQWPAMGYWKIAANLVAWWPHIVEQAERIQGGAAFRVPWRLDAKPKFEQIRL